MQQIANLSYKSKFWDKSRQLNLYQAVKERKEVEWHSDASSEQEFSQKSKNSSRSKGSKFSRRSIRSKTKNWEILRKRLAEKASLGMMPVGYRHSLIPNQKDHQDEEEKDDKSILLYSENLSVPSHARRNSKYIQVKVSQIKDEEAQKK